MDNWRLNQLRKMLLDVPDDSFISYAIAQELLKMEKWKEAIDQFESLKKKDPEYIGLYYHLARCYTELDMNSEALKTYNEGISIANKLGEQRALSELQNAKMNLEIEL